MSHRIAACLIWSLQVAACGGAGTSSDNTQVQATGGVSTVGSQSSNTASIGAGGSLATSGASSIEEASGGTSDSSVLMAGGGSTGLPFATGGANGSSPVSFTTGGDANIAGAANTSGSTSASGGTSFASGGTNASGGTSFASGGTNVSGGTSFASGGTNASGGSTSQTGTSCSESWTGSNCDVCVIHLTQAGNDANDGRTWATSKATVQSAIDTAAADGNCNIWAAEGSYIATYRPNPFDDVSQSTVKLAPGVAIFGGFAGGEQSAAARNVAAHVTTIAGYAGKSNAHVTIMAADAAALDGLTIQATVYIESGSFSIVNSTFSDGYGAIHMTTNGEVSVRSSSFSNCTTYCLNTGIEVCGGGAIHKDAGNLTVEDSVFSNNSISEGNGGAIYTSDGGLTVRRTVFSGNVSTYASLSTAMGGAIYAPFGTVLIDRCSFLNNAATSRDPAQSSTIPAAYGGAVYAVGPVSVDGSTFDGNYAQGVSNVSGGAVRFNGSGPYSISSSTFTNNKTTGTLTANVGSGGALRIAGAGTIVNSTFRGNSSNIGGALTVDSTGSLRIVNSVFDQNVAQGAAVNTLDTTGGGAIKFVGSSLDLEGCSFTRNTTRALGGAVRFQAVTGQFTVRDCTFWSNSATNTSGSAYGGALAANVSTTMTNTIVWGNHANAYEQIYTGSPVLRNCDVQGTGFTGTDGNIDIDPMFVSVQTDAPDMRLQPGSPCVNKGNNVDVALDALDIDHDGDKTETLPLDLDGSPRITNATVDIGAFESHE